MSEPVAALVVGCGAIGSEYDRGNEGTGAPRSHAGAYAESPRTSLVGGVDPDPAARARFTELWNVPCYGSLEEALATCRPAVASVCTPAEARLEVLTQLLEGSVRALWVEKPLAESAGSAEAMVEACGRRGVPMQVNFLRRFDRLHRCVAKSVQGHVLHADFRFSGTLENYGSHAIDLFRWFVGEPTRVAARSTGAGSPLVQMATGDGRTGTLLRLAASGTRLFDSDLWLEERRYALTAVGEQLVVATAAPSSLFAGVDRLEFGPPDPELGLERAMADALDSLLDHVERGTPLLCDGLDGLAELRIREAATRAESLDEVVELKKPSSRVRS